MITDIFGILKQPFMIPTSWIESFDIVRVDDYVLTKTCSACPEQYDIFKDNKQVAYLRLRHGNYSVTVPDYTGTIIWEANPIGDGCFTYEERHYYIAETIKRLDIFYDNN